MPWPYNSPSAAAIRRRRVSAESLATSKVYRLVSVLRHPRSGQWADASVPAASGSFRSEAIGSCEGYRRMSQEEAKRPQNVALGVIVIVLTVLAMSFADAVVK